VDDSLRVPASPWCRAAMRPKVFQGTNSTICANSVLPAFMAPHWRQSNGGTLNSNHGQEKTIQLMQKKCLAGREAEIYRTLLTLSINEWTFFAPVGLIQSDSLLGRKYTGISLMELIHLSVLTHCLPLSFERPSPTHFCHRLPGRMVLTMLQVPISRPTTDSASLANSPSLISPRWWTGSAAGFWPGSCRSPWRLPSASKRRKKLFP